MFSQEGRSFSSASTRLNELEQKSKLALPIGQNCKTWLQIRDKIQKLYLKYVLGYFDLAAPSQRIAAFDVC
jgi:hypothetical protein